MRIAIAGAGNVGRAIARELLDNGHQVLLIEKDPKAMKLQSVPDAEWLMADACEITSLDNAKLNNCQATPRIITALVEEAVSVGDVVRLFSFRRGQANLVELTLPDNSSCIGKTVEEIELPDNASLAAIVRDGQVIACSAHDVFAAGDELLFVASAAAEAQIKACFIQS